MPNKAAKFFLHWQNLFLLKMEANCWQQHVQLRLPLDRDTMMEAWAASLILLENSRQFLRHAVGNHQLTNEQADLFYRLIDTAHLSVRECLQPLRSDERPQVQSANWIETALFTEIRQVLNELPEALRLLRPRHAESLLYFAMLLAEMAHEPQRITLQLAAGQLSYSAKLPDSLLLPEVAHQPLVTPRQLGSLREEMDSIRSASRSMAA